MKIKELYSIFKKNPVICTDSREITKGSIFISLKGENFDGNKYALEAIKKGCSYAIIDDKKHKRNTKTILVDDCLKTLQELATYHRKKLNLPIIGITGTNGKTTSKELIYNVLKSKLKTYATKGNLNNHIGVPLSILEIKQNHDIAIIEMGANHQNEIYLLCKIAQPNYGIITNIGSAHLEGFKNLAGVIKTKNELYEYISTNKGQLFVNNQDDLLLKLAKGISQSNYGEKGKTHISNKKNSPFINIKYKNQLIKSNLIGDYQFYNIMLSICIGEYFKIPLEDIKKSIEKYIPKNNRSEVINTKKNKIILDAYNANPSSVLAMLKSFAKYKTKNKVCIIGDMLELGNHSKQEHEKITKLCVKLNLNTFFIGNEFKKINRNAYKTKQMFIEYLKNEPIKNKTILVKGSRGLYLEKLIKYL